MTRWVGVGSMVVDANGSNNDPSRKVIDAPSVSALCSATWSAFASMSIATVGWWVSRARVMAIAPLPVPMSMMMDEGVMTASADSMSVSVSGRGMRTWLLTKKSRP